MSTFVTGSLFGGSSEPVLLSQIAQVRRLRSIISNDKEPRNLLEQALQEEQPGLTVKALFSERRRSTSSVGAGVEQPD